MIREETEGGIALALGLILGLAVAIAGNWLGFLNGDLQHQFIGHVLCEVWT
jgi:hypothetical protein